MNDTPIERILAKFPDAKRSGSGWSVRCPAHEDRSPSLSITEGDDGRALVHCHAGCSVDAICEAVGLRVADLMPERIDPVGKRNGNGKRRIVTTYDYRDENGHLLYQAIRYTPKGFSQRQPKDGGGWVWNMNGARRVPYHLPELLDEPEKTVFVAEGEKDVDNLVGIGLLGTCNVGGGGNWRPDYSEFLLGRRVVILPDNDVKGHKHAQQVAGSLQGKAASVRVVKLPGLPPKGDVSDWLDQHDAVDPEDLRDQIEAMANAAPEWTPEAQPCDRSDRSPSKPEKTGLVSHVTEWRSFPVEVLPDPIRGFVRAGSKALGCDPSYIAVPMLAGLGSAIGATTRIELKRSWQEPAVVWTAIVGESGSMKSPALGLALGPLKRLQAYAMAALPELQEQYTRDLSLFEADMGSWKRKGRQKGEPPPEKPEEPQPRRYLVDDVTIEALADRLQHAPRGLLCAVDELAAWLASFGQYKSGAKGGDVARWLSIHRAENLLIDRKTGPSKKLYIPRAAVSVSGGIQPETLRQALGAEHRANGLAARLLLAMPPRSAKRWTDATVDAALQKQVDRVFGRLLALDFCVDDDGQLAPVDIPLSPAGKRAWITFYNDHAKRQASLSGDLAAAASKLEGYAGRLALIIHMVRWAADDASITAEAIDAESIEAGAALVEWFGREAQRVYASFAESDQDRDRHELVELIRRQGGQVTARDLQRCQHLPSAEHAEHALGDLAERGLGMWVTVETGGRPASVFRLQSCDTSDTTPAKPEENGTSVTTRDTSHAI